MQNIDEFQNNKEPLNIKSFKAKHKALNTTSKQNQSYDPYSSNTDEKYITLEDDKELPF